MTVREIKLQKDPVLHKKAERVTQFDNNLSDLVIDLRDTLHAYSIAVGLAAPQIGVSKQVAVINLGDDRKEDLIIINPRIINTSGPKDKKFESCMSVPHVRGSVEMRKKLKLEYHDLTGKKVVNEYRGFMARVIRHEVDHLQGCLYVDRMAEGAELESVDFFREEGYD